MESSSGQVISVLEELMGEKKPKRTFWEKYFSCYSICGARYKE